MSYDHRGEKGRGEIGGVYLPTQRGMDTGENWRVTRKIYQNHNKKLFKNDEN